MIIKKKDEAQNRVVLFFKYLLSKRVQFFKKIRVLFILLIFFAGVLSGLVVTGFFGTVDNPALSVKKVLVPLGLDRHTKIVLSGIVHENVRIPLNYMKGVLSNPDKISIDIGFEDYQRLAYIREKSVEKGFYFAEDDDFVPAKLTYNGRTVDVRLRPKGDLTDHLEGDKWSFRVKVRGDDSVSGMKVFSIQDIKTRFYLYEWLFQKTLEREGIISLRYDFVDVTINGKHKGIYALEEHFDKRLVEHNEYREGPIVRFNEEFYWRGRMEGNGLPEGSYFSSDVDAFQTSKVMEDALKYEQFIKAKDLLQLFRDGDLEAHEVFDVDKFAKYIAISEVLGARHGYVWHNYRFYYNPITSKLEPIGFDSDAGDNIEEMVCCSGRHVDKNTLFEDYIFFERYVHELEMVSQKSYLDELFSELDGELQMNMEIVYRDYPYYRFSKGVFYENQNYIRKMLNPIKGLEVYFNEGTTEGSVVLDVGNVQLMPIDVLSVSYNSSVVFYSGNENSILKGKSLLKPVQYEVLEFVLPDGFVCSSDCVSNLTLNYRLLGHSVVRNESVYAWSRISDDFIADDFIRQEPNIDDFEFLYVDDVTRKVVVMPGDWVLDRNLIIPPGYVVVSDGATSIDIRDGAKILSYSPLYFSGSEESPIVIMSSDSTGQGIAVFNAINYSFFSNVYFVNLSAPSQNGWELTGAVTFYESPVVIDECYFSGNKAGDDMLNFVRTEYKVNGSVFEHILSDAIDDDFGVGIVAHCSFVDIGNDALDFSGADVNVSHVFINRAGDKGLSAGEGSQIEMSQVEFNGCNIAIASKDLSFVDSRDIKISLCNIGFAVYQKKSEFGPAKIVAESVNITDVVRHSVVEIGSNLLVDGENIVGTQKNVYGWLYGEKS